MSRTITDKRQWWERLMNWLGQHELAVLVMLALVAGGVWGFIVIAEAVGEGETRAFDRMVLLAMRDTADPSDPLGPRWFEETVRDFTALGSTGILIFLTLSVAGFLVQQREYRMTWLVLMAVGGGMVLTTLLKEGFGRPRPDLVPHGAFVTSASFPSGHAMVSAATYLTLGALLARTQSRRRLKAYLLLLAIL
ncbi:MAG TPA: phosphatase PAP2 family protein, partial [Anaerolineae bacterium]